MNPTTHLARLFVVHELPVAHHLDLAVFLLDVGVVHVDLVDRPVGVLLSALGVPLATADARQDDARSEQYAAHAHANRQPHPPVVAGAAGVGGVGSVSRRLVVARAGGADRRHDDGLGARRDFAGRGRGRRGRGRVGDEGGHHVGNPARVVGRVNGADGEVPAGGGGGQGMPRPGRTHQETMSK